MSDIPVTEVNIGPYVPGDEAGILAVFNRVFSQNRTLEIWNWEYRDNPEGIHCFLAKSEGGRIVSQFTGIPRRMKLRDRTVCFAEIVDSLTDPEFRSGLKKPGHFASTCYAFVDHFGRPDREIIMYGLPNPPAFRVGRALLGYVHLYDVELMTAASAEGGPGAALAAAGGSATVVERFDADADTLQESAGRVHECMTVRDARYLNWRYAARPDIRYAMIAYRDAGGRLFGISCSRHRWLNEPVTAVAELFFERDHPLVPAAVQDVLARARAAGDDRVKVLVRPGSPEWNGLGAMGFVPEPSQFRFVARTYDKEAVPLDWLKASWYVSLGDFDIA